MITSLIGITVCCSFFVVLSIIPPTATAIKRTGVDEYIIRDHKTRKRQNYLEESGLDSELFGNIDDIGPLYNTKSFEPDDANSELPSFIVDYANMIRNDIILLDNSVETRTRKRGNIKVEKYNQAIPDVPCNCELSNETKDLGENTYPRYIENRTCNEDRCQLPYKCKPRVYNLTVLKRRISSKQESRVEIPSELRHRWVAEERPIVIACICTRDYIIRN